jgi:hypothetical protein
MQTLISILFVIAIAIFNRWRFERKRKQRREYYRNDYLKSEAWQRKRYVVLKGAFKIVALKKGKFGKPTY